MEPVVRARSSTRCIAVASSPQRSMPVRSMTNSRVTSNVSRLRVAYDQCFSSEIALLKRMCAVRSSIAVAMEVTSSRWSDANDASRPIEAEEIELCKKGGVTYTEVQVANDGIAVVTNPGIDVSCLTTDQLKQLWNKGSTVSNLSELGNDAETGKPLPDAELSLYGPGTDSGTFDYFTEQINGEEGVSRTDYHDSVSDRQTASCVGSGGHEWRWMDMRQQHLLAK